MSIVEFRITIGVPDEDLNKYDDLIEEAEEEMNKILSSVEETVAKSDYNIYDSSWEHL